MPTEKDDPSWPFGTLPKRLRKKPDPVRDMPPAPW